MQYPDIIEVEIDPSDYAYTLSMEKYQGLYTRCYLEDALDKLYPSAFNVGGYGFSYLMGSFEKWCPDRDTPFSFDILKRNFYMKQITKIILRKTKNTFL